MNIAIIPARGGSIRVPRKNARPFCGHPLVAWSIVQAKDARLIDLVVLSTDDDEIEQIGKTYGADMIIRRPDWPDADQAAANRPLLHAVGILEESYGTDWTMACLLPTSPLRLPGDIDRGMEDYHRTTCRIVSMVRTRETFIYRDRDGIDCYPVITDKFGRYLSSASGIITINSATWYKWFVPLLGTDLDADLNSRMEEPRDYPLGEFVYTEYKPWQAVETDTPDDFMLCECIMETFILKGRTMAETYGGADGRIDY